MTNKWRQDKEFLSDNHHLLRLRFVGQSQSDSVVGSPHLRTGAIPTRSPNLGLSTVPPIVDSRSQTVRRNLAKAFGLSSAAPVRSLVDRIQCRAVVS
jgi:hypothetical protein